MSVSQDNSEKMKCDIDQMWIDLENGHVTSSDRMRIAAIGRALEQERALLVGFEAWCRANCCEFGCEYGTKFQREYLCDFCAQLAKLDAYREGMK